MRAGLRKRFQSEFGSVAVLTPYKAQQRVLQNIFRCDTVCEVSCS